MKPRATTWEKTKRASRVALFLIAALALVVARAHEFGLRGTELSGTLAARIFPGPPNYSSVEAGDRARTVCILQLAEPINIDAREDDSDFPTAAIHDVREVQLIFSSPEQRELCESAIGKPLRVVGELEPEMMGGHYMPVIFFVHGVERLPLSDSL